MSTEPAAAGVVSRDVALETEAFQVLLEGHRADPDNEDLHRDMLKAKAALEVAWLRALVAAESQ
jgi:hypothetical protein